jgi:alkanesulfonate monooxygenase SsuD/methylene tetrahydromethanopterin reductase-like flavin-dependent oxidoreductase (luciferase family)
MPPLLLGADLPGGTTYNEIEVSGDPLTEMKRQYIAGWGGAPLVGTAEQIAEGLAALSAQEIDGVALTFPRYEQDLRRFVKEVLPLVEQMGLRVGVSREERVVTLG